MAEMELEKIQRDAITAAEPFEAEIGGHLVRVKAVNKWPASNVRAVKEGDFTTWAEKCLVRDHAVDEGDSAKIIDYYSVWEDLDPTMEQVEEFFNDIKSRTGKHPGK